MNLKILKYIFICYLANILAGSITYRIIYGSSLANILFFAASVRIQFVLSIINLFVLFISSKNYFFLGVILFFLPQIAVALFLSTLGGYFEETLYCCYIPFFFVQIFFYLKVKKMFTYLEN